MKKIALFVVAILAVATSCKPLVNTSEPTGLSLNPSTLTLAEGASQRIYPVWEPSTATEKLGLTWTSSDEAVATVSSNGTVTAVTEGTATITATSEGGLVATCVVTVPNYYDFDVEKFSFMSYYKIDSVNSRGDSMAIAIFEFLTPGFFYNSNYELEGPAEGPIFQMQALISYNSTTWYILGDYTQGATLTESNTFLAGWASQDSLTKRINEGEESTVRWIGGAALFNAEYNSETLEYDLYYRAIIPTGSFTLAGSTLSTLYASAYSLNCQIYDIDEAGTLSFTNRTYAGSLPNPSGAPSNNQNDGIKIDRKELDARTKAFNEANPKRYEAILNSLRTK